MQALRRRTPPPELTEEPWPGRRATSRVRATRGRLGSKTACDLAGRPAASGELHNDFPVRPPIQGGPKKTAHYTLVHIFAVHNSFAKY